MSQMPRAASERHGEPRKPRNPWLTYRAHKQWADMAAGFGLGLGTGLVLAALIGALPL